MKVLSIRQPWAWLIVNGFKDIENRKWATKFRGEFLIHAGQQADRDMLHHLKRWSVMADDPTEFLRPPERLVRLAKEYPFENPDVGGIVGKAELVDCVTESPSMWFQGKYGFVLQNAEPMTFLRMPGKLGFFEVEI